MSFINGVSGAVGLPQNSEPWSCLSGKRIILVYVKYFEQEIIGYYEPGGGPFFKILRESNGIVECISTDALRSITISKDQSPPKIGTVAKEYERQIADLTRQIDAHSDTISYFTAERKQLLHRIEELEENERTRMENVKWLSKLPFDRVRISKK